MLVGASQQQAATDVPCKVLTVLIPVTDNGRDAEEVAHVQRRGVVFHRSTDIDTGERRFQPSWPSYVDSAIPRAIAVTIINNLNLAHSFWPQLNFERSINTNKLGRAGDRVKCRVTRIEGK